MQTEIAKDDKTRQGFLRRITCSQVMNLVSHDKENEFLSADRQWELTADFWRKSTLTKSD